MGRLTPSALLFVAAALIGLACEEKGGETTIRPAAPPPAPGVVSSGGPTPGPGSEAQPTAEPVEPVEPVERRPAPLPDPAAPRLRSAEKGFVVVTREDCLRGERSYDLVVHFHGVADAVERQWSAARLGGVLAVANAGTWGRDYKAVYEQRGAYQRLLDRVDAQLAELCPERPARVGRVALSGWSAGYAAIRAMLRDAGNEPVDAVLLSDGIHASLVGGAGRAVLSTDVEPFVAFGELARRGEKLLSITHSAIRTPDYASTTETTDYLLERLDLTRVPARGAPGADRVELRSEVTEQGFRLRGYSGESGPEHGWHLHALDETLFADLRAWWSRPIR